jgi:bla regulator protein BlaR1
MNALIESLNRWSQLWLDAMAGLLWQSTLLALAVAAVCWMLRRHSPALRYGLWLILSAKLLAMPFWSVDVEGPPWLPVDLDVNGASIDVAESSVATGTSPASAVADRATDKTAPHFPAATSQVSWRHALAWRSWLLLIWLVVVLLAMIRTAWQFIRLKSVLAGARPVADEVKALVGECAGAIGLRKPPLALQVDGDRSPLVCGILRPVLLLPTSQASRFDIYALRQIILHELAHLRRRDLWTIWLIHAMRTVYWFHPVAHWIAYRAGLERELACDQLAMTHSGASAAAYARTLIQAACRSSQPMALSAAGAARLDGGKALIVMEASR